MTVTVAATVELDNQPPRVRLDVAADDGETSATITRLNPDGRTVIVRTEDDGPLPISGGAALLYDYELPYGQAVSYSSLESPGEESAQVTVDAADVWLIHVGVPALSLPVRVASFGSRVRPVERAVYRPMGAEFVVVHTDGHRKAPESTIELNVADLDELSALEALTSDASDLLLNVPVSLGWGVPTSYISVGDLEEVRLIDYAAEQRRYYVLPYQVVDRPVGGSQAQRTLVDLLAYPTLGDLQVAYPTLLDVLAGP